jgi:hypothetical protein
MFCGYCASVAGAGTLARVSSHAGTTKTPVEARAEVPGQQLVRVAVLPFD